MNEPTRSSEPLLRIDLGSNGGLVAPHSAGEMLEWIEREVTFWDWLDSVQTGTYKAAVTEPARALRKLLPSLTEFHAAGIPVDSPAVTSGFKLVMHRLYDIFMARGLPHSTSALGVRIDQLKALDPVAASAYAYACVSAHARVTQTFDARDTSAWRGYVQGLIEIFSIQSPNQAQVTAYQTSLSELQTKYFALAGQGAKSLAELKEQTEALRLEAVEKTMSFAANSRSELDKALESHRDLLAEHDAALGNLRTAFREEMALREPVEYWRKRQFRFAGMAAALGVASLLCIGVLGMMLLGLAQQAVPAASGLPPDPWKVTSIVLIAALGIWAIRLLVRMFLSFAHIATDASERVTMVMTYLALVEGGRMTEAEDRKLILAALFRTGADGLVKDEGVPHPAIELLTRGQR